MLLLLCFDNHEKGAFNVLRVQRCCRMFSHVHGILAERFDAGIVSDSTAVMNVKDCLGLFFCCFFVCVCVPSQPLYLLQMCLSHASSVLAPSFHDFGMYCGETTAVQTMRNSLHLPVVGRYFSGIFQILLEDQLCTELQPLMPVLITSKKKKVK